jgi:hypothetical protein
MHYCQTRIGQNGAPGQAAGAKVWAQVFKREVFKRETGFRIARFHLLLIAFYWC